MCTFLMIRVPLDHFKINPSKQYLMKVNDTFYKYYFCEYWSKYIRKPMQILILSVSLLTIYLFGK